MNAPRLTFNREDARQAAIACQRAYLQPSVRVGNAQAWFGWEIYNDSFWAPIGGPQTANPQSLVIGIAGTDEFGDILQDARVLNRIEVGNTGALVHRGFWAHWSTLRNELIAQLTRAVEPWPRPTRIVIAGHGSDNLRPRKPAGFFQFGRVDRQVGAVGMAMAANHQAGREWPRLAGNIGHVAHH